jgi:hypothetical protein
MLRVPVATTVAKMATLIFAFFAPKLLQLLSFLIQVATGHAESLILYENWKESTKGTRVGHE